MKVLIIGDAGFLGWRLARRLGFEGDADFERIERAFIADDLPAALQQQPAVPAPCPGFAGGRSRIFFT